MRKTSVKSILGSKTLQKVALGVGGGVMASLAIGAIAPQFSRFAAPNSAASGPLTTPEREGQTTQRVIEFGSGARTTLPLSQAAVNYYRSIGVSVD